MLQQLVVLAEQMVNFQEAPVFVKQGQVFHREAEQIALDRESLHEHQVIPVHLAVADRHLQDERDGHMPHVAYV